MLGLVLSPALSAVGVSLTLMAIVADLKIVECIYKHRINPEGRLACSCREITRPFYSQCRALIESFVPELAFSELGAILDLLLMYFKKHVFSVFWGF